MNRYRILLLREQVLDWAEVDAENEKEAREKAYKQFHNYNLKDTEYDKVELLEEDIYE